MNSSDNKISNLLKSIPLAAILIIILTIVLSSCEKKNIMGPLQGQWQIMSIERPDHTIDEPRDPRLYLRFNLGVLQLSGNPESAGVDIPEYVAEVTGEDPDYTFNFPYVKTEAQQQLITQWGIDANPVKVTVQSNSSGTMVLKIGENILTIRKF